MSANIDVDENAICSCLCVCDKEEILKAEKHNSLVLFISVLFWHSKRIEMNYLT